MWGMSVRDQCEGWVWGVRGMAVRDECEGWMWWMSVRDGIEGWAWGVWGWVWGMSVRDGCEGWVRGMRKDVHHLHLGSVLIHHKSGHTCSIHRDTHQPTGMPSYKKEWFTVESIVIFVSEMTFWQPGLPKRCQGCLREDILTTLVVN